jgi:hypothetical protein
MSSSAQLLGPRQHQRQLAATSTCLLLRLPLHPICLSCWQRALNMLHKSTLKVMSTGPVHHIADGLGVWRLCMVRNPEWSVACAGGKRWPFPESLSAWMGSELRNVRL